MKVSYTLSRTGTVLILAACSDATEPVTVITPPPWKPPFNVSTSLSDTVIRGNECHYLLRFEANDSARNVDYVWAVDAFQSHLPGVGGISGGARGSFKGSTEESWQFTQRAAADTFNLVISYAMESGTFAMSGWLRERCPP